MFRIGRRRRARWRCRSRVGGTASDGLDVIALVGLLRHREHRSVPEIHAALRGRGVEIAERSVTNLLDRYDELLATSLTDTRRLRRGVEGQGGGLPGLGGPPPPVGAVGGSGGGGCASG